MVQKKFSKLNWLGLLILAGCFIYLFIIYLVMFCAEPTFFAGRWYAGQFGSYAAKIVICIAVFASFLAGFFSLIAFSVLKANGRNKEREKFFGIVIVACAVLNLILAIVFLILQGEVFDGSLSNAESTVYRIIDISTTIAAFGGVWMLVIYSPRYDRIKELKKQRNRI